VATVNRRGGGVFTQRLVGEDELRLPLVRVAESEFTPPPPRSVFLVGTR
jgi:hypothetical protein